LGALHRTQKSISSESIQRPNKMKAPYDKNGKTLSKGSYVKFENKLWEVFDWDGHYNLPQSLVWLEPRAGNESGPQWGYAIEMEVTDMKQLHLDI